MKTFTPRLIIILIFAILSPATLKSQFLEKLADKAVNAAERTVERRVERESSKKTDEAMDEVFEGNKKKSKKEEKNKKNKTEQSSSNKTYYAGVLYGKFSQTSDKKFTIDKKAKIIFGSTASLREFMLFW